MADNQRPKQRSLQKGTDGQPAILSISYDEALLKTREWILTSEGYRVASACGFTEGEALARQGGYDLAIVGHSIPERDKIALIEEFRKHCQAPVLSLTRQGDAPLPQAAYSISASEGPEVFVKAVRRALDSNGTAAEG